MHRPALLLTLATVALGAAARLNSEANDHDQSSAFFINPSTLAARDLNVNADVLNKGNTVDAQVVIDGSHGEKRKIISVAFQRRLDGNVNVFSEGNSALEVGAQVVVDRDLSVQVENNKLKTVNVTLKRRLDIDAEAKLDRDLDITVKIPKETDTITTGYSRQKASAIQMNEQGMMIPQVVEGSETVQKRRRNIMTRRSNDDDKDDEGSNDDSESQAEHETKAKGHSTDDIKTSGSPGTSSADKNAAKDQSKHSSSAIRSSSAMMGFSVVGALVGALFLWA
ncbi:hypothetical protein BGX27_008964 [Mortierella sp. AM989]|nr:hypothetical protein BGX27_008964 [Mortierella sp. AM989]